MKLLMFLMSLLMFNVSHAQDALCYSEQTSTSGKGWIGKIGKDISLFYEAWNVRSAGGTFYSAIILRTDTSHIADSIDFCLDSEHQSDSVFVSIYRNDSSIDFIATKPFQVPTLYQVLTVTYGFQNFHVFNKENSDNSIVLDGDKLYVTYSSRAPYDDDGVLTTETYKMTNGLFQLVETSNTIRDK